MRVMSPKTPVVPEAKPKGGEQTPNVPNAVNTIGINKMFIKFREQTHGRYHPSYQLFTEILGLKLRKYGWQRQAYCRLAWREGRAACQITTNNAGM
jgi:hypothetical protein